MDLKLEGKIALVTGSARGIGLAEATALGDEGAKVVINDIDGQGAQEAAAVLRARGIDALAVPGDASDEQAVHRVVEQAEHHFGALHVLVNNAGIGVKPSYRVESMPAEAWDAMIVAHMRSTFLATRAAIPAMRKAGFGRIINTSSMNFTGGGRPGVAHYAAAKAGILGLTRTTAKEVGPYGITVNAVAPGYVETALISQFDAAMREVLCRQNPVGRTCKPEEVAALAAFLASEQAAFINGALVCIDGGRRDFFWGEG